jgi:hypothetical protein
MYRLPTDPSHLRPIPRPVGMRPAAESAGSRPSRWDLPAEHAARRRTAHRATSQPAPRAERTQVTTAPLPAHAARLMETTTTTAPVGAAAHPSATPPHYAEIYASLHVGRTAQTPRGAAL